jgi:hypothetical protein
MLGYSELSHPIIEQDSDSSDGSYRKIYFPIAIEIS